MTAIVSFIVTWLFLVKVGYDMESNADHPAQESEDIWYDDTYLEIPDSLVTEPPYKCDPLITSPLSIEPLIISVYGRN